MGDILWRTALLLWVPLSIVVAYRARDYKRSPVAWFILSFVFSPFVSLVFLVVADVPYRAIQERQKAEYLNKRYPEERHRDAAKNEGACSSCKAILNVTTGEGLVASREEPWRLFCVRCETEYVPFD